MSELEVRVRNANYQRVGELDDYASLAAVLRFQDVSNWAMTIDASSPLYLDLIEPGAGIEVWRDAGNGTPTQLFSGPWKKIRRNVENSRDVLNIEGVTDTAWLNRRIARPEPLTPALVAGAPGFFATQSHDIRSGAASTIMCQYVDFNAGASALPYRRVPTLTCTDPVIGSTMTARARFQNLLDLIRSIAFAGGDLGFDIIQNGNKIEFTVYQPVDRSDTVIFSRELGNLEAFNYEVKAPETNSVLVAGQGELTAREIVEDADGPSITKWGLYESFHDRRDTDSYDELILTTVEDLKKGAEEASLEITPIDTDSLRFGVDYNLGDIVTVVIDDGTRLVDTVRQVKITWTKNGEKVEPLIGNADAEFAEVPDLFRRQRYLAGRVQHLESV